MIPSYLDDHSCGRLKGEAVPLLSMPCGTHCRTMIVSIMRSGPEQMRRPLVSITALGLCLRPLTTSPSTWRRRRTEPAERVEVDANDLVVDQPIETRDR